MRVTAVKIRARHTVHCSTQCVGLHRRRLLSVNGSRTVERRQKLSRWRTMMRTSQISRNECDVVCGGSTARSYINLTWATGRQWRYHAAWGRAGAPPDHGQAPKFSRTFNALRSIASRKKISKFDATRCQILRLNAQNSTSAGAPLQTPLGELTALPQTLACI